MMEGAVPPDEAGGGAGAIPIISVTQHSPAASKAFFILGLILLFQNSCV